MPDTVAAHTPGPWRLQDRIFVRPDGQPVAGLVPSRMSQPVLSLTLAAPDMLTALGLADQRIVELCAIVNALDKLRGGNGRKVRADDYAAEVRAAIAKAKGRQS